MLHFLRSAWSSTESTRAAFVMRYALQGLTAIALTGQAHAQSVSPRALLEVADLAGPIMSPDGKSVAFRLERASIERNSYDSIWYVQDAAGKAPPRRIADGGVPLRDPAGGSTGPEAIWSPDGRWLYYRAAVAGRVDVWRAATDGSAAEPITRDPADIRHFSLSADGNSLTFGVGATREQVMAAEEAEYDRGIRIDESIPIGQPLFRSGNVDGRLATQRYGGVWFDRAPLLSDSPLRWKTIHLESRSSRDLPDYQPPAATDAADLLVGAWAFMPEPDGGEGRVALLTRVGNGDGLREKPGVELLMLPDEAAARPIRCQAEPCTGKAISRIQWRPGSDEILFTVSDPHQGFAQSIYRWNVLTGAVHRVTRSDGLIGGGRDRSSPCGLSREALICVTAAADQPPRLERIDLATGRRRLLFDPNSALRQIIGGRAPAQLLRWRDTQGREFTGQFFPARTDKDVPPPLFLTYYSCTGFLRGGIGDEWPLASLAEQGISALCVNDPPGYLIDAVARYDRALAGVKGVIDLLASQKRIDRNRVGMGGLSFGSEVTLWVMMKSDLLAASSVTSPVRTANYFLFNSLKGDAFFSGFKQFWQLGSPTQDPERWKIMSPAYNLAEMKAPMLLQMPEQEYLFSLEYAIPLIRGRKADLYVFANEPHQKFQPKHKLAAYARNIDWFRFWLQGHEDDDPLKTEQYGHWREMLAIRR